MEKFPYANNPVAQEPIKGCKPTADLTSTFPTERWTIIQRLFRDDVWSVHLFASHSWPWRPGLTLQIHSYPNPSPCWVSTDPIYWPNNLPQRGIVPATTSRSTISKHHALNRASTEWDPHPRNEFQNIYCATPQLFFVKSSEPLRTHLILNLLICMTTCNTL
jgi:hypothetical protein